MNEYYAVVRSSDHLSHYGVKGMKWGVRRALDHHSEKSLGRHYAKAQKKLNKLNKKADVSQQTEIARKYNKVSKISRRIGHVGAAVGAGSIVANKILDDKIGKDLIGKAQTGHDYNERINRAKKKEGARRAADWLRWMTGGYKEAGVSKEEAGKRIAAYHKDIMDKYGDVARYQESKDAFMKAYDKSINSLKNKKNTAKVIGFAGAGLGALGYGTAAVTKGKAIAAKYRTTAKGHTKAVAKRDAWQKEMNEAFKGTKYDSRKRKSKSK